MAYAATSSLKQTIQRLLNSSHISIDSSSREILDFSYKHLTSLQEVLRKSDERRSSKRLKALDGEIREALQTLEDSLETHASEQFLSSHEEEISSPTLRLKLDLKEVWHELNSFAVAVKKMEEEYIQELDQPFSTSDEYESPWQTTDPDDHVKMVGLSDAFDELKDHLTRIIRPDEFGFFSFYGKAGIGRSSVAESVYNNIRNEKPFDCGAWVRIGSTYQLKEILLNIISQINGVDHEQTLASEGDDKISEYLYSILKGRRYIVGLDDVRGTDILIELRRSFPEQHNGSLVFVATGLMDVALLDEKFFVYEIPTLLYEDQIWNYIRIPILGLEESVLEFEEAGKKIAKNCDGRGLVVARIMLVLLRSNKRKVPEFWKELAAAEHDRIYMVEDEAAEIKQVKEYLREGDEVWAKGLLDYSIAVDRIKSEHLYPDRLFPKMGIMTLYGMAGVGKTTLIKKLFEDPSILNRFDHYAWVSVGLNYQSQNILVDILAQIFKRNLNGDAELASNLCKRLSGKKCLIVLDDLWSQEPVHFLKNCMPNIKGELVVTTSLLKVGMFGPWDRVYKVRLLNKDESWDLLREKVFGKEICPHELEKAGKKIAENCEGLPLMILTIADILFKSEKTLEYWNMVATRKNPIFMNAQIKVAKSLVPNYEMLPQPLKACFLYMGIFPQYDEIYASKLMRLWFAEGFLEPNPSQTFEDYLSKCLKDLVDRSMVMVRQKGSDSKTTKTYGIHSVYWHLSNTEAIKSKFFYMVSKADNDTSMQCRKIQRRLSIPNSILLGNKDVCNAMVTFSSSRALICSGPAHQYPVPLYLGLKLLRVVDALAIRFYEFPIEAVKLIHLRYLALTCDGQLPSSISKLWNLQFMIVRQHLSINSSSNSSYLPKEIWDMKELKHLQIAGNGLPSPDRESALLPNLISLLDVSAHSCTIRVFERMPNLKKLGIRVELAPSDNSNPLYCLDNIFHLSKLESLKCVVVNPDLGLEVVPRSRFPTSLKKLSLSGLGYPWEYMGTIGKLQNLEVLKLQCYAFIGPAWELDYHDFSSLKFFSIEDSDLVRWDLKLPSMLNLESLSFKHCYNLEELPSILPVCVQKIEVVNCHPLSENWAVQMKEKNWERKMKTLEIHVQSSWND